MTSDLGHTEHSGLCGHITQCPGQDELWGLCLSQGRRKERLWGVLERIPSEREGNQSA